jgi:hypothetical protein
MTKFNKDDIYRVLRGFRDGARFLKNFDMYEPEVEEILDTSYANEYEFETEVKRMFNIEEAKKDTKNIIEIEEEVTISQEDGSKVVLEKGDRVEVLKEMISVSPMIKSSIREMLATIDKFYEGDPADMMELGQYIGKIIVQENFMLAEGMYEVFEREI